MGWTFRKSLKVGGARVNLSRGGVGWSVGAGGVRYGKRAGAKGRADGGGSPILGCGCLLVVGLMLIGLLATWWRGPGTR